MPESNEKLEAYLDAVCRQLWLPVYARRVRRELRDHIMQSALAIQAQERIDAEQALAIALRRMGDPYELGRQLALSHKTMQRLCVFLLYCVIWVGIVYCIASVMFALIKLL